jgi:hypothetical protein
MSKEQGPSLEANSFSVGQLIPRVLWNVEVHRRIHNSLPPVRIFSQTNSVHAGSHFLKNHFNIIFLSIPRLSKWFIPL